MDIIAEAFRRAHRTSKVLSFEAAIGPILALPSSIVGGHAGPWEDQLVAQALIVLRKRGVPEPVRGPNVVFENMIKCVLLCQEIAPHEHSHPEAGRKPAA